MDPILIIAAIAAAYLLFKKPTPGINLPGAVTGASAGGPSSFGSAGDSSGSAANLSWTQNREGVQSANPATSLTVNANAINPATIDRPYVVDGQTPVKPFIPTEPMQVTQQKVILPSVPNTTEIQSLVSGFNAAVRKIKTYPAVASNAGLEMTTAFLDSNGNVTWQYTDGQTWSMNFASFNAIVASRINFANSLT